jgi:2-methylcitrate synthase
LASKKTLYGFGHPYYPGQTDTRVGIIERILENSSIDKNSNINKIVTVLKDEIYKKKKLFANVELYLAQSYLVSGFPAKILSNITLLGRIGGICAHILEQKNVTKKIYLHPQKYVGFLNKSMMKPKF